MGRLINGDAIEFMKTLEDESVDLIVTDPPYKVTSRGNAGSSGGMMQTKLSMQGKIFKHNDIKPIEYIPEFYRLLKDGYDFDLWMVGSGPDTDLYKSNV